MKNIRSGTETILNTNNILVYKIGTELFALNYENLNLTRIKSETHLNQLITDAIKKTNLSELFNVCTHD